MWSEPAPLATPVHPLTPAEKDVLKRMLSGASNSDIARQRNASARTVANQMASLFRKHGVHSRAELVARLAEK